jgi:hypothetical protein
MTSYFGQKVKACLIHAADIEMALLKLVIRRALESNCAVSYKNKIFVIPPRVPSDRILITRLTEPDVAMEIPSNRTPDATDRFIDSFVFETGATIDDVMFHKTSAIDSSAIRWHWLKSRNIPLLSLISQNHKFQDVVGSEGVPND